MIAFPTATAVHRRLPKEAFYTHLTLTTAIKNRFISDVDKIRIENSLTQENLHLMTAADIKEIVLLSISLKKETMNDKVIETIAKQNQHHLVFLLTFEERCQLAIYHRRLYRTPWMDSDDMTLTLRGQSLDEIWDGFLEQIALCEERAENIDNRSIADRLAVQATILKLEKLIKKTENAMWKELQPKKKFELHTRLREYKQKLEELKHGESEDAHAQSGR